MSSLAIGHLWGCSAQCWVPASEAFGLCWETEFPISKCLSTCYVLGSGGCDRTPVPAPQGGDIQTEEATQDDAAGTKYNVEQGVDRGSQWAGGAACFGLPNFLSIVLERKKQGPHSPKDKRLKIVFQKIIDFFLGGFCF